MKDKKKVKIGKLKFYIIDDNYVSFLNFFVCLKTKKQ